MAAAAALIAEPARAALLIALVEGDYLAARELAARAGIGASTASGHLARLLEGRLVVAHRSGRHRYFRLANTEVARAIDALSAIAPERSDTARPQLGVGQALRDARMCYDHVAGRLGINLAAALEAHGVLVFDVERGYRLKPDAAEFLVSRFGIDVEQLGRRRRCLVRACVDWREHRRHVAGTLGAALATALFERGWINRREGNRSLEVTVSGHDALRQLGIEFEAPA